GHQYEPERWVLRHHAEATGQWDGYRTRLMRNSGYVDESAYITDALSREAVDFVARQPADQPFLVFLAYNAPHTPLQAPERYLQQVAHIQDPDRRTYAAMLLAVDQGVGLLLDHLEAQGQRENTLVFFLTDNGGAINDNASSNQPLRAGKGSYFEGGLRVPFTASWPGVLPAGVSYTPAVSSMDIMATVLAAAGVTPAKPLDGVDLVPFVRKQRPDVPHEWLFWRHEEGRSQVVRWGDYKWMVQKGDTLLFNLAEDVSEQRPL
ncbi:sulfatase-like hydrolase/transferase, partial [Arthrospira platensis SPKY1]|nr:sulfatase-like hydrolase/transferase [Arthrospira platensis SPKY1]